MLPKQTAHKVDSILEASKNMLEQSIQCETFLLKLVKPFNFTSTGRQREGLALTRGLGEFLLYCERGLSYSQGMKDLTFFRSYLMLTDILPFGNLFWIPEEFSLPHQFIWLWTIQARGALQERPKQALSTERHFKETRLTSAVKIPHSSGCTRHWLLYSHRYQATWLYLLLLGGKDNSSKCLTDKFLIYERG